jgi:hypothetical protein
MNVLLGGIPSVLVAIVGLVGVRLTQASADERQYRIAREARDVQQYSEEQKSRVEAGSSLVSAVLDLAQRRRVVLSEAPTQERDYSEVTADDRVEVDIALAHVLMVCDEDARKAARKLVEALDRYPATGFSAGGWSAVEDAVDTFADLIYLGGVEKLLRD